MHRRPPRSTRTASLFPSPTLFRSVVELDAFIDLALLDRRVDQADDAEAGLFATFHGRLHVFDELGFESHGFGAGHEGHEGSEGNGWKTKGRLRLRVPAFGLPRAAGRAARPAQRSEEARVGKECVRTGMTRWAPFRYKTQINK